jgi:pimeloyl-ACP methyl ester carboxylesterase
MIFYTRYRRELGAFRRRVPSSRSSITETRLGAIEQVTFGEGPPVLLVHGVVGGADQGRGLVGAHFGDGFKVVAVSRFGYGGSPLPTDSSPRAQARCLVPQCGGGRIDATTKETLWDRYFTGAPRPLTPSEQQYSDRRLRSRR